MNWLTDLRWPRAIFYGFLAEMIVLVGAIALAATAGVAAEQYGTIPLCFAATFLFSWIIARRPVNQPVLHGAVVGISAFLIYFVLGWVIDFAITQSGTEVPAELTQTPPPGVYETAHVMKVLGGIAGSWIASRRTVAARAQAT